MELVAPFGIRDRRASPPQRTISCRGAHLHVSQGVALGVRHPAVNAPRLFSLFGFPFTPRARRKVFELDPFVGPGSRFSDLQVGESPLGLVERADVRVPQRNGHFTLGGGGSASECSKSYFSVSVVSSVGEVSGTEPSRTSVLSEVSLFDGATGALRVAEKTSDFVRPRIDADTSVVASSTMS